MSDFYVFQYSENGRERIKVIWENKIKSDSFVDGFFCCILSLEHRTHEKILIKVVGLEPN